MNGPGDSSRGPDGFWRTHAWLEKDCDKRFPAFDARPAAAKPKPEIRAQP
jgi:hypothetical protein